MSQPVLFIGNGLNLLETSNSSWSDVINGLAGVPATQHEADIRKSKPFTLWFEELLSSRDISLTKKHVCEELSKAVKPNDFHKKFMSLEAGHVLTTNYDYALEMALESSWNADGRPQESYFSLFRRNAVSERRIWHIHGEVDHYRTIMLGHGQYSRYVTKICNFLDKGVATESKARKKVPFVSKFSKHFEKSGAQWYEDSWVDRFLESEVHIVGFGFDYTENDIWHLLTVKKELRNKGLTSGGTVFHHCFDDLLSVNDEARHSLLRSFGVEVKTHKATDYPTAYETCFKYLTARLK